jgi:CDGSH-type Zn-finger protein
MITAKIAQIGPYVTRLEAGSYIWCACGLSKDQPFCDSAHRGTEYEGAPNAAMLVEIEEDGEQHWCGCKQTQTPPFCDGSHEKL